MTVGIGVVGYGYWGPNLVRNFSVYEGSDVIAVCDRDPDRLKRAKAAYPAIEVLEDYEALLKHPKVDAIAIATSVNTHYHLAKAALMAGKHVLVEKPMTEDSESSRELVELAAQKGLVLLVDHTFTYTGAVNKIRDLVKSGEIGDLLYYDSIRVNLGLFQHDVNVLWDLAVHDLSILLYITDKRPVAVSAQGVRAVPHNPESVAYMSLFFSDDTIAHINVNWLAPVKVRQTLIGGTKKMVVYDDLDPSEKIRIYDKGVEFEHDPEEVRQMLISYRSGDVLIPRIAQTEALQLEVQEFVAAIEGRGKVRSPGSFGLEVVQLLEAATQSLEDRGRAIEIK